MKGKILLDLNTARDYCLLGISCHLKDYRFVWLLNRQLEINLRRLHDFYPRFDQETDSQFAFPLFYEEENFRFETFYLLGNHSPEGDLIDKPASMDYLFFIHDLAFPGGSRGLIQEIRKIPQVIMAWEVKMNELKDGESLISGIELCLMEYQKNQKEKNPYMFKNKE